MRRTSSNRSDPSPSMTRSSSLSLPQMSLVLHPQVSQSISLSRPAASLSAEDAVHSLLSGSSTAGLWAAHTAPRAVKASQESVAHPLAWAASSGGAAAASAMAYSSSAIVGMHGSALDERWRETQGGANRAQAITSRYAATVRVQVNHDRSAGEQLLP